MKKRDRIVLKELINAYPDLQIEDEFEVLDVIEEADYPIAAFNKRLGREFFFKREEVELVDKNFYFVFLILLALASLISYLMCQFLFVD